MFDSTERERKIENQDVERESYLPVHHPLKSKTDNGDGFSNNTIYTQREEHIRTGNQSEILSGIVQRKLFPIAGETEIERERREKWNGILEKYTELKAAHPQLEHTVIDDFISEAEADWYGSEEHSASVNQFNAFITLKGIIKTSLQGLKIEEGNANHLSWDDIIPQLREIQAKGFIEVTCRNRLSGGHGAGIEWRVNDDLSGSVPDSTHGRNDSALRGARGAVRSVISFHNSQIDAEIGKVDTW